MTGRKALLPPTLVEAALLRAQGKAGALPGMTPSTSYIPAGTHMEREEGSAPLASTACISSLSCTPFKLRPEQHSKGITVVDCGVQGNPQLHNKRDRKGCQRGSKDISTFKGCSCSQKTCSGITTVPWVQADSRAPAGHSPLPGYPLLQGKDFDRGQLRGAAEPGPIPCRFLCSAGHQPCWAQECS